MSCAPPLFVMSALLAGCAVTPSGAALLPLPDPSPALHRRAPAPLPEVRDEDWPMFRDDLERSGFAEGSQVGAKVSVLWEIPAFNTTEYGAVKGSPSVVGDMLYCGTDTGRFLAARVGDGHILWQVQFDKTTHGVHGSPAIVGDVVYIGAYDGTLYALERMTGLLLWRHKLGYQVGSSPAVVPRWGVVYSAHERAESGGGYVLALDARTGEELWQQPTEAHPHSSVSVDVAKEMVFVGDNRGIVYMFHAHTGQPGWRRELDPGAQGKADVKTTPMVIPEKNLIVFGAWSGKVYALDEATGRVVWEHETGGRIMGFDGLPGGAEHGLRGLAARIAPRHRRRHRGDALDDPGGGDDHQLSLRERRRAGGGLRRRRRGVRGARPGRRAALGDSPRRPRERLARPGGRPHLRHRGQGGAMGSRHAQLAAMAALVTSGCNAPPLTQEVSPVAPAPSAAARGPVDDDPPEARALRDHLVAVVAARHHVHDPRVLEALRAVPRQRFYAAPSLADAYLDSPRPIGLGQTISQPAVVGLMTEALELTGAERVLEIGTGSGYQAAVLSHLARQVDSIELLAPLGEAAARRLAAFDYANVTVRIGDGYQGWPERAPYDRILLTAAPPAIPPALVAQLAEGGILVAPVGADRYQRLLRLRKRDGRVTEEDLGPVLFVPMVEGDAG